LTPIDIALLIGIGVLAGFSNAVVGGGTLFTFPAILAVGLPPVIANATTTVALWPGTMTSAHAQLGELKRASHALPLRMVGATAGGLVGAVLLLASGDTLFFQLVPWLLAIATALFTFSRQIVKRVARLAEFTHGNTPALVGMEFVCAIYGGYFGAAIGILLLASMARAGENDMQSANAQRNYLVCFINGIATVIFVVMGVVDWTVALIVMGGAIVGGYVGGKFARRIPGEILRHMVTAAGVIFSAVYFYRAYG
jgi:uncharacterized membrane protein YfcA